VLEALEGDQNFFPDLVTRWAVRPKDILAFGKISRLATVPIALVDCDDYDWPSIQDMMNSQRAATIPVPDCCTFAGKGLAQFPGAIIWIPDETS
jgi:hypothetical protein